MRVTGGAPTAMTNRLKRVSLAHLAKPVDAWLAKLRKRSGAYAVVLSSTARGRHESGNGVPKVLQAPKITVYKAASKRAAAIAKRSRWGGLDPKFTRDHVDPSLIPFLDVIVVHSTPTLTSKADIRKYLSIESDHVCHKALHCASGWTVGTSLRSSACM
jgi:hypothetical protein